jgi:glutamate-ammonia-ligase adenylyltransferase
MTANEIGASESELLIRDLPDPDAAARFLARFTEMHPAPAKKLSKNPGLLSDVLTLASFSPLLALTLEQNPEYLSWLALKRIESGVTPKDELLESLARFSLTHSQVDLQIILARFRRRELLRIFLRDIRRLATISEITEEISNLADAILEFALRSAQQEMENRYGLPLKTDEKGRATPADVCVVALGKLGSKELNYSSDIDLVFIYEAEGATSGQGTRNSITNREYFIKLAEFVTKLVGQQTGEGAAYRVDLRLRPHGRMGALALSVDDTIKYYRNEARAWERQVLIRSRAAAGNADLFRRFYSEVEDTVFSADETVEKALESVRLSKEKIDLEQRNQTGYNVKLGKGGIREIEFIAQALQLAYGGRDRWLRSPHTLISLSRLADRGLLTEHELTELFDAYEFLRHLEHLLQMENGLQTHTVPDAEERRRLISKRMNFKGGKELEQSLRAHTQNVSQVFERVFGGEKRSAVCQKQLAVSNKHSAFSIQHSAESAMIERLAQVSPRFTELLVSNPQLAEEMGTNLVLTDGRASSNPGLLIEAVIKETDFGHKLAVLRRKWVRLLLEIAIADVFERLTLQEVKRLQTELAEAAINAALLIVKSGLEKKYLIRIRKFPFVVLGLGKLGGRGIDYDSDLDVILVYDDNFMPMGLNVTLAEFYGRATEIFVTALSSMTRDGSLYRVDLRLRPFGKNGTSAISKKAFLEYVEKTAAIWEMLAYVKIRGVAGEMDFASSVETESRRIIHERASAIDRRELAAETTNVRRRLEAERGKTRGKEIDIKYGAGGMLDIYFATRFLQLRDNVPDDAEHRATAPILQKLREKGSLSKEHFTVLLDGYNFFAALDHNIRLTVGRTTHVPIANRKALDIITERIKINSSDELIEQLTIHRLNVRNVFEDTLS